MTPKLLSPAQLAEVLGVHPKTIARNTRAGHYPFARNLAPAGKQPFWRYDPRGLDRWLDSRRSGAA